jgi:hypothetical protein
VEEVSLPGMWSHISVLEVGSEGGILCCHNGIECSSLNPSLHCYVSKHVDTNVMCVWCVVVVFCRWFGLH